MDDKDLTQRRGLMLVLSSPSGAGKTTLSRKLLEAEQDLTLSISATTRPPRPGEVDGQDYFFVSQSRFDEMVAGEELLEYATVFDHSYGTPAAPVNDALESGRDVLFDIDWQGTQQLEGKAQADLVRVFILPPSMAELESRLKKRAQDSDKVVQGRMAKAQGEISHWFEYDYVLVNVDVEKCLEDLRHILNGERNRRARQTGLSDFVKSLVQDTNSPE